MGEGHKDAKGIVLLEPYAVYYDKYKKLVDELLEKFPVGEKIIGEQNEKDFIKLYNEILRLRNILVAFDEFPDDEILTERNIQDYHSMYIDLYHELRGKKDGDKENINDDIIFEMELIKQVEINIDYILELVKKYHEAHAKDKELLMSNIDKAINSSIELRNKKDLIHQFIDALDSSSIVDDDWHKFINKKKIEELEQIIEDEDLAHDKTYTFIRNAFRDGNISSAGQSFAQILPATSFFTADNQHAEKYESVLDKLTSFFERFFDISSGEL